jgi:hypothetical protein
MLILDVDAAFQPARERAGLLGEPEAEQRVDGEGGVASAPALLGLHRIRPRACDHLRCRAPQSRPRLRLPKPSTRAILTPALWHQDQFSLRCRGLEQFVRVTRFGERQALRDHRMDLPGAKQFEQRVEVLTEPLRVAGLSTRRSGAPCARSRNFWIW